MIKPITIICAIYSNILNIMGKGNPISKLFISRNIKSDLQHYKRNITINLDYLDLSSLN